jgi:hypothetical protein
MKAFHGLLILALVVIMGCASSFQQKNSYKNEFIGIRILNTSRPIDEVFEGVTIKNGSFSCQYNKDFTDLSVIGKAKTEYSYITLTIINSSKLPLEMNYISDQYNIVTQGGSLHKLEVIFPRSSRHFSSYSDYSKPINPGDSKQIRISGFDGKPSDIRLILAKINYGKTLLALKPVTVINDSIFTNS